MTTGVEWSVDASDDEWNDYDPKNGELPFKFHLNYLLF